MLQLHFLAGYMPFVCLFRGSASGSRRILIGHSRVDGVQSASCFVVAYSLFACIACTCSCAAAMFSLVRLKRRITPIYLTEVDIAFVALCYTLHL